jgi:hypothetical protein
VTGAGGGEGLDQLGDEGSGQGAARDDDGEFPPHGAVTHAAEHPPRRQGREQDRHRRGDPHQTRQGLLEVELVNLAVLRTGDGVVDEVRQVARHQHDDSYHEDPHQQLHLFGLVGHRAEDERHQGDPGDAVGLESIGRRPHRVTGIVTGAVGDDAGVTGVVLLDVEGDLHEVRAHVGDLGEDAAGDTQAGSSQRLTDGEADETWTGQVAGQQEHDRQHHEQFDTDEHHADAHARTQRNVEALERATPE